MAFNANLDASTTVSSAEATYLASSSANNMASGTVKPDFTRTVQLYDNLGGSRSLTYSFLKSATPNQWHVEIYASPASDVTTGAGLVDGQVATGIVAFSGGKLDTANTTLPTSLTFGASNAGAPGAGAVNWGTALGIEAQTVALSIGGGTGAGGITQFDSASTLNSTTINGSALGNLTGVTVGKDGVMTAVFDNGLKRDIYKLPVATFVNPDGLYSVRGTAFRATADAGPFTLKEAGLEYKGKAPVRHMVEVLIEDFGYEQLGAPVVKPLEGLKFAGYVGCQTNRPFGIAGESFENPMYLDKLVETVGAEPLQDYDQKVTCCGGALAFSEPEKSQKQIRDIVESAYDHGADMIVTPCPLCQANVEVYQSEINRQQGTKFNMPVTYYSQLMTVAYGGSVKEAGLDGHLIPPKPLLDLAQKK